ncbi:MAG: M20/M25/M40 family metallo-hydrolase [Acidimicrobiia bacterium]|nr:M20/M25/M40 family metallo-hydrolase [Acidimicrobiia bacterium]
MRVEGSGIGDRGSGTEPVDPLQLARQLIDIESTTGNEGAVAKFLADFLRGRGYSVLEQPVPPLIPDSRFPLPRTNVIAAVGEPDVVFSTHFDCVPPFFPSRVEDGVLYGRGACDAKSILAAQVAAAERLRAKGETRLGLVFVAGEERGSDGAKAANRIASKTRFLINGEPTDLRLGSATRGCYRVRLTSTGKAAHSGYPELGESAIEKLMDCLHALRAVDWPSDPLLGKTHYTVGLISGGVAPNVIPPNAEAEVFFRTVGEPGPVRETLTRTMAGRVDITEILELPAVRMHTVPGFETAVFSYFSDVPFLSNWGKPLLLGPGSIHVAHTDREHLSIDELHRAVDVYQALAAKLLASS